MERTLQAEHGISIGHCAEAADDPHPEVEESISYHTDSDTLREELKTLAGYKPPDDGEEEFGL